MVLVWSRNSSEGFLSTPSARRATNASINKVLAGFNFYPRPLRGGRRGTSASAESRCYFYPRPLRGGRRAVLVAFYGSTQFLSTPSARRATNYDYSCSIEKVISIHALCEEGDERNVAFAVVEAEFLSTPSARRATAKTETKSLFSNKLYNILHEFRRALIYNGSKNDPNHAK